jgi:hypothetical protein
MEKHENLSVKKQYLAKVYERNHKRMKSEYSEQKVINNL